MWLEHLSILNFKNIAEAELDLCEGVNCLLGDNGMGKSNLLEAVHFLSFTRPMRSIAEQELMRHGADAMMVKGTYQGLHDTPDTVSCGITAGKSRSKKLRLNGKEYGRISEHIGKFPVVTVSPDDTDLIRGTGHERRRLMNMVISQTDASYAPLLMRFNRSLESRNSMLRAGVRDKLLYESVEATMAATAREVYARRRAWAEEISPLFARYYSLIADASETASTHYVSVMERQTPEETFEATRAKDTALGYTSAGIHHDDLTMELGERSMRRQGSQGQMKTFTIALRLAIFDYTRTHTGLTPLLLLDDIFDKLDASRVERIVSLVSDHTRFGQIFITDTNRTHLDEIVAAIGGAYRMFRVEEGHFSPLNTDADEKE